MRQVNRFVGRQIWPTKAQEVGIFVKVDSNIRLWIVDQLEFCPDSGFYLFRVSDGESYSFVSLVSDWISMFVFHLLEFKRDLRNFPVVQSLMNSQFHLFCDVTLSRNLSNTSK